MALAPVILSLLAVTVCSGFPDSGPSFRPGGGPGGFRPGGGPGGFCPGPPPPGGRPPFGTDRPPFGTDRPPFGTDRPPFPGEYIVGGNETTVEENPWQVTLQLNERHRCGGSIISERWILTAAHCTDGYAPSSLTVRVGSSHHFTGGVIIATKQIVEHANYSYAKLDYDYALIELRDAIELNDKAQIVKIPDADTVIPDGTVCRVSGWGATHNPNEANDQLRQANVPIVNQEVCNEQYDGRITSRMICAGLKEGGKDSCQGDSGGPLTCEVNDTRLLTGVVSWGIGCAQPNYSGVYARVTEVRAWIKEHSGI